MARINRVLAPEKEPAFHRSKAFADIIKRNCYQEFSNRTRSIGTLHIKSFKKERGQSIQCMNSFHSKNIDKTFVPFTSWFIK